MNRMIATISAALLAVGLAHASWGDESRNDAVLQDDFVRVVCERIGTDDQRSGILYVMDQDRNYDKPGNILLEEWSEGSVYEIPFNLSTHEATLKGVSYDQKVDFIDNLLDGAETKPGKATFLIFSFEFFRSDLVINHQTRSDDVHMGANGILSDHPRTRLIATGRLFCETMLVNAVSGEIIDVPIPWQ